MLTRKISNIKARPLLRLYLIKHDVIIQKRENIMGEYIMKKLSMVILAVALILALTACGSEPETIEGYWMAENGETISFNSDGKAIVDGFSLNYSIYDETYLSISFIGLAEEYRFDLEKDTLTLTDLSNNSKMTYYRDEVKQAEIQKTLNQIAAEQAEQERIQQEAAAQAQAQEDYEKHVSNLKNRLETIDKEIPKLQGYIRDNEGYIADSNQSIQEELISISELQNEISQLQNSSDEMAQADIAYLEGTQEYHHGNIEYYNGEIEYYNNEISRYKEKIATLEREKEEIIQELKTLDEY